MNQMIMTNANAIKNFRARLQRENFFVSIKILLTLVKVQKMGSHSGGQF